MATKNPRQKQRRLFEMPLKARAAPRVLMQPIDAGPVDGCDPGHYLALMKCDRCQHQDWYQVKSVTESKRDVPCPICNKDAQP